MLQYVTFVIFDSTPGRYDLIELPTWRPIASGSLESVESAARLLGLICRKASPSEVEERYTRETLSA